MSSRRDFLKLAAGAAAGRLAAVARPPQAKPGRRRVTIAGRPVRVIDVHAHCVIPVPEIVQGTPLAGQGGGGGNNILGPRRLDVMDEQGVDVQALSINGYWWYAADRDLARRIILAQNEGLASWVASHPDRFVAMASVSLQHSDLAAEQLEDATKRLGLRGVSIGGHVNGDDVSLPTYDPFWAKATELGTLVFMHPGDSSLTARSTSFPACASVRRTPAATSPPISAGRKPRASCAATRTARTRGNRANTCERRSSSTR